MSSKRIQHFDVLKGIAIFMVVMGHVIAMCIRGLDGAFLFKFIEQTHMPIFFFISGYLTYAATERNLFKTPNLKKRFMQLIIPFLVITPLWVLYFPHSGLQSPLSDNLPALYRAYWKDGYWFTLCLFELFLVYYPLSLLLRRLRRAWMQIAAIVATYALLIGLAVLFSNEEANVDYPGLGLLARFFPIFIMGVMAHHWRKAFDKACHNSSWIAAATVTFAIAFFIVAYRWDMPWAENNAVASAINYLLMPPMQLSLIVLAIAMAEPWCHREFLSDGKPGRLARYFDLMGHKSLGIYLLHYFFLFPLTALQEPLRQMALSAVPLAVVSATVAFAIVAVTLLVIYALERSRLLAFLFLGQPMSPR
ncbi:MAG: acyltransferase [Muribaculaceae bacterium]|nr:acyltransferase [Muribaculaceae bacterium]